MTSGWMLILNIQLWYQYYFAVLRTGGGSGTVEFDLRHRYVVREHILAPELVIAVFGKHVKAMYETEVRSEPASVGHRTCIHQRDHVGKLSLDAVRHDGRVIDQHGIQKIRAA